ncbi:DUF2510 domain-containing protein [Microcella sp.]|uniref:DUF2510 domain-containing protein n=1 Tax=Microcella sp. TaxID=1913979 RepID=UPI003919CC84
MTTTAVRVPAGWYADPLSADDSGQPTHRRWWDGHGWTHHTALIGDTPRSVDTAWSAPTSPDISPATVEAMRLSASYTQEARREAARIAETMSLHATTPVSPATPAAEAPATRTDRTPAASAGLTPTRLDLDELWKETPTRRAHSHRVERPRVHTASLWLIAVMPITQVLIMHWVLDLSATGAAPQQSIWLAMLLPFVLYGALASQDARQLAAAGHLTSTPWIVAVIMPAVYLGSRGVQLHRTTGASPWPALLLWGTLQAIVVAVATVLDPAWFDRVLAAAGL